jgi:hypothetical protein
VIDDLGHRLALAAPPRRIVSLVPSLTEALAVTVPERLVAATEWCTHPPGLDLPRVRGTKNPDRRAIEALAPDLVVANQEENRRLDVERLRAAGIPVWVTAIESVDAALRSMRRLFTEVLAVDEPQWLRTAAAQWSRPAPQPPVNVAVPIWRDPWMVVGPRTFTGDLLSHLELPQRPAPRCRHQALPPPGGRRPHPRLRKPRHGLRTRAHLDHLRRRARVHHRTRPRATRLLGSHPRP